MTVDQQDREFMLSIFLMEAWDALATIEEGSGGLLEPGDLSPGWADPLLIVTHRLKGSAALYSFPGVSELASKMEQLVEQAPSASPEGRRQAAASLSAILAFLKKVFDGIAATGREDVGEIAAFKERQDALFAETLLEEAPPEYRQEALTADVLLEETPAVVPVGPSATTDGTSDQFFRELDDFFSENADILTYFGPEAAEHLEAMTSSLLALERVGPSQEELATLFRAVHTLKGAAYTVGFTPVGDLAHRIEDLLAAVQEEQLPLSPSLIEAVFGGIDTLKLLLGDASGLPQEFPAVLQRAVSGLGALMPSAVSPVDEALPSEEWEPVAAEPLSPPEPLTVEEVTQTEPALILPAQPEVLSPPESTPAWEPEHGERRKGADWRKEPDRRAAVRPSIRVPLDRLDSLMNLVGELVIARSRLERRLLQLDRVGELMLFSRSRMGQVVRDFEGKHQHRQLPAATSADSGGSQGTSSPATEVSGTASQLFAELEFDRYDDFNILARSVGEISADVSEVQTQLVSLVRSVRDDTSQIQRLTGGLRNEITQARMVPIGTLFARFARQVREASKAAGKAVSLEVSGETVELDNTINEQIADPLLHLVQNAISHGIELEVERRSKGKPPHGTVYLSAYHQGSFIYVEVEDDGRGIDVELLKQEAVSQGFLRAEMAPLLSEREALNLIFLPGFSTASSVTTVSGRGVGMDVVRTNVSRLNGEIDVESEVGVGTRFTIKLPLTVVISDALMVRVGTELLAIPLTTVKVILAVRPGEIQSAGRSEMVRVEGELVDLIRLDMALELPLSERGGKIPVVVLRSGGKTFAVAVDELLGKEEIVIKSLGSFLEGVGPFGGATISGEGRVILLIDPVRLLETGDGVSSVATVGTGDAPIDVPPGPARRQADAARRVLLVDDSISVRKFVGHMLEKAGIRVITANDGAEALQRLGEVSVQAVITDLEMPRVNGYELIENLKRRPNTKNVPIVVLTTRAGEKHLSLAQRLGVKHYVTKPVDEQSFVQLIDALISPSPAEAELSGVAR